MAEKIKKHVNSVKTENDFEHAHQIVEYTPMSNIKEAVKKQINEIQPEEENYNEFERQKKIAEERAIALEIEKIREKEKEREREREREQRDREQERYSNAPTSKSTIEKILESDFLNSNFGFFLLVGIGVIAFISFKDTPGILKDSWKLLYPLSDGTKLINMNFSSTLFPAMLMAAIDIYCFSKDKLTFSYKMGFGEHLISQVLLGFAIYLANLAFTCVVEIFGGLPPIEGILGFFLFAIYYVFAYSCYMLPVAIIFAIFATVDKENS